MSGSEQPIAFTIAECAAALRVSPRTIRRAIAAGKLEAIHLGRLVRVPSEALSRFLEAAQSKNESQLNSAIRTNGRTDVHTSEEYARGTEEQRP